MNKLFASFQKMSKYRNFIVLIIGAIVISFSLVVIAMIHYMQSGAAQLDLSRPSYRDVRKKVQKTERFDGFDTSKPLDESNLDKFEQLYDQKMDDVRRTTKPLSSDVLSNETLEIKLE